jgi:hypothetical protein
MRCATDLSLDKRGNRTSRRLGQSLGLFVKSLSREVN